MMLKLKLQYFGHLMRRVDSLEKTLSWEGLRAGGEGDHRGWDGWMASLTQRTWVWVNSRSWWWTGRPGVLQFMGSQRVGHHWDTELNWTELKHYLCLEFPLWERFYFQTHFFTSIGLFHFYNTSCVCSNKLNFKVTYPFYQNFTIFLQTPSIIFIILISLVANKDVSNFVPDICAHI